jgi:hypothetical protein
MLFSFLWDKLHGIVFTFGLVIALIQLSAYVYTAMANPGIPKSEYETINYGETGKNFRRCKDCKLLVNTEEKTYHCYECEICIEGNIYIIKYNIIVFIGFDHHCPWTSKCIGAGNLKSFYVFVGFTMVLFGFLIFSVTIITP